MPHLIQLLAFPIWPKTSDLRISPATWSITFTAIQNNELVIHEPHLCGCCCQFMTASVVLLEVGNWLSPAALRGLAINLLHRIEQSRRIEVVHVKSAKKAQRSNGWLLGMHLSSCGLCNPVHKCPLTLAVEQTQPRLTSRERADLRIAN
jgi:hypothetical protein